MTTLAEQGNDYQKFHHATQKTVEELHRLRKAVQPDSEGDFPDPSEHSFPEKHEARALYTHHWRELDGHASPFAMMYEEHGHTIVETEHEKLLFQTGTQWEIQHDALVDVADQSIHVMIDRVASSPETHQPIAFVRTRYGKRTSQPTPDMRDLLYLLAARQRDPEGVIQLESPTRCATSCHL